MTHTVANRQAKGRFWSSAVDGKIAEGFNAIQADALRPHYTTYASRFSEAKPKDKPPTFNDFLVDHLLFKSCYVWMGNSRARSRASGRPASKGRGCLWGPSDTRYSADMAGRPAPIDVNFWGSPSQSFVWDFDPSARPLNGGLTLAELGPNSDFVVTRKDV